MSKPLRDAFVEELRDIYDAEKQLLKALAKLAKAATSDDLRKAFEAHLQETRGQLARLAEVFARLDEKVRGKHCDGIAGIIKEGASTMQENFNDSTMDACLIAAGQRAEHYEIAAYGSLAAWAKTLDLDEVADLLEETLEEEKAADERLSALAEGGINAQAADGEVDEEQHDDEEDEDEDEDEDEQEEDESLDEQPSEGGSKAPARKMAAARATRKPVARARR